VPDPISCKTKFKPETLRCAADKAATTALATADCGHRPCIRLQVSFRSPAASTTIGLGRVGRAAPSFGPTGGWKLVARHHAARTAACAWQRHCWVYGAGGMQYVFARAQSSTSPHTSRKLQGMLSVGLMDSTNPDLSRFAARGARS
jgi:feruloyl esterase